MAFPQLREQAVALRLAGKSLREIKEITGVTRNSRLNEALRGVPPPEWTRRPRAKDAVRDKARELRARGYSMLEIAAELGVSKSSCRASAGSVRRRSGPVKRPGQVPSGLRSRLVAKQGDRPSASARPPISGY